MRRRACGHLPSWVRYLWCQQPQPRRSFRLHCGRFPLPALCAGALPNDADTAQEQQKVGAWVRVTSCMREVCENCVVGEGGGCFFLEERRRGGVCSVFDVFRVKKREVEWGGREVFCCFTKP